MFQKKIFNLNAEFKTIAGSALVISGATLLSRVVGLFRDRVLAHYYGAGPVLDAYYAAFKIPDLIYNLLIVGALSAGFIPVFTKLFYQNENDRQAAWDLTNNIINIMALFMIILGIVGFLFASSLTSLMAPGFTTENKELTTSLMRIMLLSPFLFGLSMVFGGVLQSLRRFFLFSVAPLFYNLGIIFGTVYLTSIFDINGLAIGVVLGAFTHMTVQYYGAYQAGFRFKKILDFKNSETRLIGKLMLPRTAGLAIAQIDLLVVTFLASFLPAGSLAVYTLANNLQAVPVGLIGIPFALAVFPVMSKLAAEKNIDSFTEKYHATLRQIIFLIAPFFVIFLILNLQIVRLVLGSGSFDWHATLTTAQTLFYFTLGMFFQSIIPLMARAFYSLSDTKTPFFIGVISEIAAIVAAILLMQKYGVCGLAMGSAIGAAINMSSLFLFLHFKLRKNNLLNLSYFLLQILGALAPTYAVTYYFENILENIFDQTRFYGVFLQTILCTAVSLTVFYLSCYLFKLPEINYLFASFKRQWLKIRSVPNEEFINPND